MYYNKIPKNEKDLHTLDSDCGCNPRVKVCEDGHLLVTHNELCTQGGSVAPIAKDVPMTIDKYYFIAMAVLVLSLASIVAGILWIINGYDLDTVALIYGSAFVFYLGIYFTSWFLANK